MLVYAGSLGSDWGEKVGETQPYGASNLSSRRRSRALLARQAINLERGTGRLVRSLGMISCLGVKAALTSALYRCLHQRGEET